MLERHSQSVMTMMRAAGWFGIATTTNRDYTQAIISTLNVLCPGLEVLRSLMSDKQHRTAIMAVSDIKFLIESGVGTSEAVRSIF